MTPEQLRQLIRFLLKEIEIVLEHSDVQNDKDIQRMYQGIDNVFEQIGINLSDILPVDLYKEYLNGLKNATKELGAAGVVITNATQEVNKAISAPVHVDALSAIVSDTMLDLSAAIRTAKIYAHKNLDETLTEVQDEIAKGILQGKSTKKISKRVAEKFAEKKMTAFVTKDGKHLPLDFYAETVVRTKKQTASNHAHLNRYDEKGVKHVTVTGAVPTCATCARYRGIVFSTQRGDKFPYLNLYTTFPLHPNCKCNFRPFVMKFKRPEEIDKELSKAKQFNPDKDPRSVEEKKRYDDIQKVQAKARRKSLSYEKMKRKLGAKGPQTYNEYLNVRNNNKQQYHEWVAMMKKLTNDVKDGTINVQNKVHKEKTMINDKMKKYAKEVWQKELTEDEKTAIKDYTLDDKGILNKILLSPSANPIDEIKNTIENISSAINKFDFNEELTLYRGVGKDEYDFITNGNVVKTFLNFKSTSLSNEVATNFSVINRLNNTTNRNHIIIVKTKPNTKGAYIGYLSNAENEQEYLLDKGSKFNLIEEYESDNYKVAIIEVL